MANTYSDSFIGQRNLYSILEISDIVTHDGESHLFRPLDFVWHSDTSQESVQEIERRKEWHQKPGKLLCELLRKT